MAQIYIAGIHTDAGKTHFSAAFCHAFAYDYFKLIQAGAQTDSSAVARFAKDVPVHKEGVSLRTPASPHIAKMIENRTYSGLEIALPNAKNLAIELAGGLYTPLDDRICMIDFVRENPRAVVLVGRYYLGCINHILLSVNALREAGLPILCIAMIKGLDGESSDVFSLLPDSLDSSDSADFVDSLDSGDFAKSADSGRVPKNTPESTPKTAPKIPKHARQTIAESIDAFLTSRHPHIPIVHLGCFDETNFKEKSTSLKQEMQAIIDNL